MFSTSLDGEKGSHPPHSLSAQRLKREAAGNYSDGLSSRLLLIFGKGYGQLILNFLDGT